MEHAVVLRQTLASFGATQQMWRHNLNRSVIYTDGVRFFAQNAGAGAYWLLDILATQPEILRAVKQDGLVIVVLDVQGRKATLTAAFDTRTMKDGDTIVGFEGVYYTRQIDLTDCPEGQWKFYMERTVDGDKPAIGICLPQER